MADHPSFLKDDETIYWQGAPVVSLLNVKSIAFYILPGIFLLLLWCGVIGYEGDLDVLNMAYGFIHQENILIRLAFFVLFVGLTLYPVIRWFLYYKCVGYMFTDRRALAYDKGSSEILFQIDAADIRNMRRTYDSKGRVSLYQYIQEETPEDSGTARIVRVGFEGIPAHVLGRFSESPE